MESLWDLNELLCEKIDEVVKQGDISPTELDNVYKATKAMYYISCIDAMEGSEYDEYEEMSSRARGGNSRAGGGGGNSRNYPYSSRRSSYASNSYAGGGGNSRRSSRGNSMRNYSGHDKKEMLMQRIAELQDEIDRMED